MHITLAAASALVLAPTSVFAVDYLNAEQAAKLMFPDADQFESREVTLDAAQMHKLSAQGVQARSAKWSVRVAHRGAAVLGFVVVDEVIGKFELITYAVGIGADGSIKQVEILSYRESHGHEIRLPAWRRQFVGKAPSSTIQVGDDIANISGATLSCKHVTDGVKRIVAIVDLVRRNGALGVNLPGRAGTGVRRARPLLGTLVEVGARGGHACCASKAVQAAFDAIIEVQARLSRFDPDSDIARFHAMACGMSMAISRHAQVVLAAAQTLQDETRGLFDISLGTAPDGWRRNAAMLQKLRENVWLDLGGIAKGYAVDQAIDTLIACGCDAGWVNAGGDLRVFGDTALPLSLRDEHEGGTRPFASLRDGAFATSHFDHDSRSQVCAPAKVHAHASVAAPLCLWADALTKVVAASGDAAHPVLARYGAQAWLH